jgi:phosphohistidine phosphatase
MKRLYLVRHALAETPGSAMKDFDRELVLSGISEAAKLGKKLAEKQFHPDKLISSDAARAQQTARYIAEQISYPLRDIVYNNEIYEASVRRLINVVNSLEEKIESCLLVGHNPGLSDFAEVLTGETIGSLPTGGLVKIEFEVRSWQEVVAGSGFLRVFDCPYS